LSTKILNKLKHHCIKEKNANSCNTLGLKYLKGEDLVKKNYKQAFEYFKMACNLGNAEGCNNVGYFYGTGVGNVVRKNEKLAIKYYKKACKDNYTPACKNLGVIYYQKGMKALYKKDAINALANFEQSCFKYNFTKSCYNAGYLSYLIRKNGIPLEKKLIKKYFKKGCDLGNQKSCKFLQNHKDL